jgi:hypothetical protein
VIRARKKSDPRNPRPEKTDSRDPCSEKAIREPGGADKSSIVITDA